MPPDPPLGSQRGHAAASDEAESSSRPLTPADAPTCRGGEEPTRVSGSSGPGDAGQPDAALISGYELIEEIHRGGQGVVYRAVQLGTKRQVALKVLLEGPFAGDAHRRRFEREVELAASLQHPNIVTILDSGISHGRYYFAMEFIQGQRLDRYLARVRPPLKETLNLFATIAGTVNFAHQRGVIHRDLKPPNILVDKEGQPHILDFGLAKPIQRSTSEDSTIQMLSMAGELLGTVAYMSPEQTLGAADVDVRSDVYSLGVVFYEALLGRLPYTVEGPLADVLHRIAQDDPVRPRFVRRTSRFGYLINDELETILLKSLEKHPVRRYQTAGELARDLRHLMNGEPIEAKRSSGLYVLRKTLRRYKVPATIAAILLATMMASLVGFAFLWSAAREAADRADAHRTLAFEKEYEARQERDAAEASRRELRRTLARQTIQAGELAQARGDPVTARDAYWRAYEQFENPAALWALRQYYLRSGDRGARVLLYQPNGIVALASDGRRAAVSEYPGWIAVRDTASGRLVGWRVAPGPVRLLHISAEGVVCAAGQGWVRVWPAGEVTPSVCGEFEDGLALRALFPTNDARRVLLVGAREVRCLEGLTSTVTGRVTLLGSVSGVGDWAPERSELVLPTQSGVQRITVSKEGRLRDELAAPAEFVPRAVRFAGGELLAVSESIVYRTLPAASGQERWFRLADAPQDWLTFELGRPSGAFVFSLPGGRLAYQPRAGRMRTWSVTGGGIRALNASAEDGQILVMDDRGTLTEWTPPGEGATGSTEVLSRSAQSWAAAPDGNLVLFADESQRVHALLDEAGLRPEPIFRPPPWRTWPGVGASNVLLAVDAAGERLLICHGEMIRLRGLDGRGDELAWQHPSLTALKHVALSPDGRFIALGTQTPAGDRQQISFWQWPEILRFRRGASLAEILTAARQPVEFVGGVIRAMAFQPNQPRLLVARSNGELAWLPLSDAEVAGGAGGEADVPAAEVWLRLEAEPVALAFDRRGERVAVATADGFLHVLHAATGAERRRIPTLAQVRSIAFHSEKDLLLVCTADGRATLLDPATGENIATLAEAERDVQFAAWLGGQTGVVLGTTTDVEVQAYASIDDLIKANEAYARQRAMAQALADGQLAKAWAQVASLSTEEAALAQQLRICILVEALRHVGQDVPPVWIEAVLPDVAPAELLQLGHAAYIGQRYVLADQWLQRAAAELNGEVDAYTALSMAQCAYLMGRYEQAAEQFAAVVRRPDLDTPHLPLVQLQQVAALVLADQPDAARRLAGRIVAEREMPRLDLFAMYSARDIAHYLTGLEAQSPAAFFVDRYIVPLVAAGTATDSALRFRDDSHFFQGELARHRGDHAEAAAQYQRCVDHALDDWPASWARYRLRQLSSGHS